MPPLPCDRQDSSTEFITPNVFKCEREESSEDQNEKPSKRVHFTDNISVHTFPKCTSEKEADKEIRKEELKAKLVRMKKENEKDEKKELKEKKDKFFSDMLPDYREDKNGSNSSNGSDCEIVQSVQNSDFTFNPLMPNVRKAICDHLSMSFHKADLKHENIGEKLFK